ncbi:MAG: aspartate aminotransferase family protein [Elusimicrobiota bacterium]|jgi:4-aminobutyrate aminotransferase-like enzyme
MKPVPGPKSLSLARRLRQVESRNITYLSDHFPVFWESAQGCRVRDVDGRSYLDLTGAFAVAALGHNPPEVRQTIRKQSAKIWHGMGDVHPNAVKVELLERLARLAPGRLSISILSSSGAEAVESALKTARLATGKPRVIAFEGAYHGLTYGTLAVTQRNDFRRPFSGQIPGFAVHLPYPDSLRGPSEEECLERVVNYLKRSSSSAVGSILIEPVQGRGGIRIPKPFFLKELQTLARRRGLLLIADEVFTGFGRTGRMFAVDHSGVEPDLMCVGKALANGFPISACIGSPKGMRAWPLSDGEAIHTSTFLGNPLGCAMALASLQAIEKKKLAQRAAEVGWWWKDHLKFLLDHHPNVGEIRGVGLMVGIELVKDKRSLIPAPKLAGRVVEACLRRGLLVLSGGTHRQVLSLTPPLIISKDELRRAAAILEEVLTRGTPARRN